MGFLTAAAIIGAGVSVAGTLTQSSAARRQNAAQQAQILAERKAEKLRKQQMELEARRRQMEILRNEQRARSVALAAATNQGAAQGSGLQGGYGQIAGASGNQLLATNQNLGIGRGLFDANMDISAARMAYGDASTDMSMGRGISSIGSTITGTAGQLNSFMGGYNPRSSYGGSYMGYGTQVSGMGRGAIY